LGIANVEEAICVGYTDVLGTGTSTEGNVSRFAPAGDASPGPPRIDAISALLAEGRRCHRCKAHRNDTGMTRSGDPSVA
jgi:hypothetical protein